MRSSLSPALLPIIFVLLFPAAGPAEGTETPSPAAAVTKAEIEADWLTQIGLRYRPTQALARNTPLPYKIRPEQDAAGGCDGVINGTWGFHTNLDDVPWWSVDLQGRFSLERVVIHNTGHDTEWKRILGFSLLLSVDGKTWTEAFRHDGEAFEDPKQPIVLPLDGAGARFVKIQLPRRQHLTLEEIEVYPVGETENVALNKPANQSSSSKWSVLDFNPWSADPIPESPVEYPIVKIVEQGLELAADLRARGVEVEPHAATLAKIGRRAEELPAETDETAETVQRDLYLEAQWAVRKLTLANPLLDFENLLFVKRAPNWLLCHCDEYLSWWSRPGGELCILEGFAGGEPRLKGLSGDLLPVGDIIRPDISYDGTKVLFSHCRHYPDLWKKEDKLDKATIPEDAFYHDLCWFEGWICVDRVSSLLATRERV